MGKLSWVEHLKTEEFLHREKKERSILYTIKMRKINWIIHNLRIV